MRMDSDISPRPATLNESVDEPTSVTRSETSLSVSRNSRSRSWRDVTNLPSRPAKGLSLTENVISSVGAEIFTNGSGSTSSGAQIVRPMVMSEMPENATISPAEASCTGTFPSPSNS